MTVSPLKSFHQLFIHELRDLASAEEQIIKVLPKLAKAAGSEALREALAEHLAQSEGHLQMVLELLESFGETRGRVKCAGIAGIISEGDEKMKAKGDPDVLDAAIIASAQKVEHYEIATYGTARAWAELMGHREAVVMLDEILAQEKAADQKLTKLSRAINVEAQEDPEEDNGSKEAPRRRAGAGARR
jgi:ferritin-like metal-binding protein YciE